MKNALHKLYQKLHTLPYLQSSEYAPLYFLESILGFLIALLSVMIFFEIAEHIFLQKTLSLDSQIAQFIYTLRNPVLNQFMIAISFLGAEITIIGASIGIIFLTIIHRKKEAAIFTLVFFLGIALNIFLKDFYQRPRPFIAPLLHVDSYSFPSMHAMNAFIFYAIMSYFVYHLTHKKGVSIVFMIIAITIILLVGFSRVYLGVHYPSDVIAGYFAGFFVFMTAVALKQSKKLFTLIFSK